MNCYKLLLPVALCLGLSACFQTSLGGPTGGTSVTVASLRNPSTVLATASTRTEQYWIEDKGQEGWDADHPTVRLLLIGMMPYSDIDLDLDAVDPDALYLVTATGGIDRDPQSQGAISDAPETAQGSWHAIVTGQRLIDGNIQISALSEALYQQARTRLSVLSDEQVLEQLDAAARLTVEDIDGNGTIDYGDVMDFMRSVDANRFRGDITALDTLASAIRSGQPEASLEALSVDVLGSQRVIMTTNLGDLQIDTLNWETPVSADNFLRYVESGFYENIFFHRVVNNFVIQAGILEYDEAINTLFTVQPGDPIRNEARWSVSNLRGTVAMARTSDPDSASSQFYINQVDNTDLDFSAADNFPGYTVFARVSLGMDIVDRIALVPVFRLNNIYTQVPQLPVFIETVTFSD